MIFSRRPRGMAAPVV